MKTLIFILLSIQLLYSQSTTAYVLNKQYGDFDRSLNKYILSNSEKVDSMEVLLDQTNSIIASKEYVIHFMDDNLVIPINSDESYTYNRFEDEWLLSVNIWKQKGPYIYLCLRFNDKCIVYTIIK